MRTIVEMDIVKRSKIVLFSANMAVEKPVVFTIRNVGDCLGVGQLGLSVGVLHKKHRTHISLETTLTRPSLTMSSKTM